MILIAREIVLSRLALCSRRECCYFPFLCVSLEKARVDLSSIYISVARLRTPRHPPVKRGSDCRTFTREYARIVNISTCDVLKLIECLTLCSLRKRKCTYIIQCPGAGTSLRGFSSLHCVALRTVYRYLFWCSVGDTSPSRSEKVNDHHFPV